ncbi:MAG: prevent-host-death protein [Actinomycetia bacterium]|nr:prevent-host-death protein [Actinomycetes bacterium]
MAEAAHISQRDLRLRSKEIMDAVEQGNSFVVTRQGRDIAELVPLHRGRRFVSRADLDRAFAGTAGFDLDRFRRDTDRWIVDDLDDPYAR